MKKSITFSFVSLLFLYAFTLLPALHAEFSSASKASELEDAAELETDTLAPPLMGAFYNPAPRGGEGLSLLSPANEPGYWGELAYQPVGENSFHLYSRDLKESAGFFWLFDKPRDLRNRWVELVYSGVSVPSQILLSFDSRMPKADGGFIVPLKSSFEPRSGYFKLPNREPFSAIQKLNFAFDPKFGKDVEMMILDLKVMPEGFDPLQGSESASYAG